MRSHQRVKDASKHGEAQLIGGNCLAEIVDERFKDLESAAE
jgi:hypothetical protein